MSRRIVDLTVRGNPSGHGKLLSAGAGMRKARGGPAAAAVKACGTCMYKQKPGGRSVKKKKRGAESSLNVSLGADLDGCRAAVAGAAPPNLPLRSESA